MSHGIPVGLDELLRYQEHKRSLAITHANTQAIRELIDEIEKYNAIASQALSGNVLEAQRHLADLISGELGLRVKRATMPGSGHLASIRTVPASDLGIVNAKPTLTQRIRAWFR